MPRSGEAPKTAILRVSLMFTLTTRRCPLTFLPNSPQNRFQMLPKYGKNPNANGHGRVLGPKTDTARVLGFEPGFFDSGRIVRARAARAARPRPRSGPLEKFRPFERAQEIFRRGARPIKSSMGKPKLGSISRSAYNRSRITRIMIVVGRSR